jgi:hypothetical protein
MGAEPQRDEVADGVQNTRSKSAEDLLYHSFEFKV